MWICPQVHLPAALAAANWAPHAPCRENHAQPWTHTANVNMAETPHQMFVFMPVVIICDFPFWPKHVVVASYFPVMYAVVFKVAKLKKKKIENILFQPIKGLITKTYEYQI